MSKRKPELLLGDILEAIERINTYTQGMQFDHFAADLKTIDAVVRNLEIIGEAANQLPADFTKKHAQIAWYQIIGIRNRVIREYFGVDLSIIWKVVQDDLDLFKEEIGQLAS